MTSHRYRHSRRALAVLRSRRRNASAGALVVAAAALAAGIGVVAAPDVIEPVRAGVVVHWGGWPLEAAYGGLVLAAAIATFRIHEMTYRSHDAAALRALPLHPLAFGVDRLLVAVAESVALAAVVGCLIAPALLRDGGARTWAGFALVAIGSVVVPLVGFAGVAIAGAAAAGGRRPGAPPASVSAAFHFAPGIAFGIAAGALLLAKLGIEEPLRAAGDAGAPALTRSALLGIGLPLVLAIAGALEGLRRLASAHDEMQALFVDAESFRVEPGHRPFGDRESVRSGFESLLAGDARWLYAKDRLQLARATPVLRAGTWVVVAVALFVGWASRGTFSPDVVGLAVGGWLALGVAPFRRLATLPGEARFGLADIVAEYRPRAVARRAAGAAETWRHALPLAACGLGFGAAGTLVVFGIVLAAASAIVTSSSVVPSSEPARIVTFVAFTGLVALVPWPAVAALVGLGMGILATAALAASLRPSRATG